MAPIRVGELSGSDATNALHETIKAFVTASGRQTTWMLRLTWAIFGLTAILVGGLSVQIWLALRGCA
jgi:hypothetical protein